MLYFYNVLLIDQNKMFNSFREQSNELIVEEIKRKEEGAVQDGMARNWPLLEHVAAGVLTP